MADELLELWDIEFSQREYKTKRVQLVVKPSTYEQLKKIARVEGIRQHALEEDAGLQHAPRLSVNEIINQVLERYIDQWQAKNSNLKNILD